jgi:hypothetical protein
MDRLQQQFNPQLQGSFLNRVGTTLPAALAGGAGATTFGGGLGGAFSGIQEQQRYQQQQADLAQQRSLQLAQFQSDQQYRTLQMQNTMDEMRHRNLPPKPTEPRLSLVAPGDAGGIYNVVNLDTGQAQPVTRPYQQGAGPLMNQGYLTAPPKTLTTTGTLTPEVDAAGVFTGRMFNNRTGAVTENPDLKGGRRSPALPLVPVQTPDGPKLVTRGDASGQQPAIPRTPAEIDKSRQSLGQIDTTIPRIQNIYNNADVVAKLLDAGKITLAIGGDGSLTAAIGRGVKLTPKEAKFAADFQSMAEDINLLRGPLGATGFRGKEGFEALQAQRGRLFQNPDVFKGVLKNTIDSFTSLRDSTAQGLKAQGVPVPEAPVNPATAPLSITLPSGATVTIP